MPQDQIDPMRWRRDGSFNQPISSLFSLSGFEAGYLKAGESLQCILWGECLLSDHKPTSAFELHPSVRSVVIVKFESFEFCVAVEFEVHRDVGLEAYRLSTD